MIDMGQKSHKAFDSIKKPVLQSQHNTQKHCSTHSYAVPSVKNTEQLCDQITITLQRDWQPSEKFQQLPQKAE